jgi:hypothetical protein
VKTGEPRELGQPGVRHPSGRRLPITLAPLQREGAQSLNITDIPDLRKITLTELEAIFPNTLHEVTIYRADDLFACALQDFPEHQSVPKTGEITRAIFIILFSDGHCIPLEIRTPTTMTCTTAADAAVIERWLAHSHFTSPLQRDPPVGD